MQITDILYNYIYFNIGIIIINKIKCCITILFTSQIYLVGNSYNVNMDEAVHKVAENPFVAEFVALDVTPLLITSPGINDPVTLDNLSVPVVIVEDPGSSSSTTAVAPEVAQFIVSPITNLDENEEYFIKIFAVNFILR